MRIDLVTKGPDLRGLRCTFRVGQPPLRAKRFDLRLVGKVKCTPGEEEEEPHDEASRPKRTRCMLSSWFILGM